MPRSKGVVLLQLAIALILSGKSWGRNDTRDNQGQSFQISPISTYSPEDFRESLRDRLSGGLHIQFPRRMVVDSERRVFVTDPALSVVHVFDTQALKRWQITGLIRPSYIAVDADNNVYVTDWALCAVVVFRPNGRFLRTIGADVLIVPTGIAVDKEHQKLYVADWFRGEILAFDLGGNLLQVVSSAGFGPGQLYGPGDIVLHRGTLIVLDTFNSRFSVFDLEGNFLGALPFGADRMPITFTFDGNGNLFYVDLYSGALVATDPQGKVLASLDQLRSFGQWAPRPLGTSFACIAVDSMGSVVAVGSTLNIETLQLVAGGSGQKQ